MKNDSQNIIVKGARVHNLKNIDVEIPKNKLVVVTGVSGSGKSSLAFDTLYAEGQRRYIESFSGYAQQFLGVMDKPDVDKIEGLPPAIAIEGRGIARNSRSTVGTMTEIYDLLRLLFSKIGKPHCPKCGKIVIRRSTNSIVNSVLSLPTNVQIAILSPMNKEKGILEILKNLHDKGFIRVRINGKTYKIEEALTDFGRGEVKSPDIEVVEVVIDRFINNKEEIDKIRVIDSVETALRTGNGIMLVSVVQNGKSKDLLFSNKFICRECGTDISEIEPRLFSFNSPHGACENCTGLGVKLEVDPNLVIPNPRLSLAEGAICPWAMAPYRVSMQNIQWQALGKLAEKYGFSLHKPVRDLSKEAINLILYGGNGFEGIISEMERHYKETDSERTRLEMEKYMVVKTCPSCSGKKLRPEALSITVAGKNIDEAVNTNMLDCKKFFEDILENKKFGKEELEIAEPIIKEIIKQLQFLINVNLEYLSLHRDAPSLSAGEAQRVRLAIQIGSKLTGVLYVLDEPSIGLHPRDQKKLICAIKELKSLGNSVVVVEHDEQTIKAADWIIDIGPGAGEHGGRVIFEGTPKGLLKSKTPTGEYLSGRKKVGFHAQPSKIPACANLRFAEGFGKASASAGRQNYLIIKEATEHNLKNIDVKIPLGVFTCITGVSGSGKSTLINDVLAKALAKKFHHSRQDPGAHKEIVSIENLNKVVIVDQSPIGRIPRSNPATYTGVFAHIRDLFVKTKQAKMRGYRVGHFSFNAKGGRCEECQGGGAKKIEMYFMPDRYIECSECRGKRYNREILEIKYRGVDIYEVLEMTTEEALAFFKDVSALKDRLSVLNEVGLGYIKLGQPAPSLSGGEAQRVKLATELSRKATGRTIYILDEPTTGLHPADIKNLLSVLKKLVDKGNTVLVIEHNLDIIKNADWIIDLGPEGGDKGGYIVAEGTPDQIMKAKSSYTGQWLRKIKNKI